jgi:hypothetical protein
MVIYRAGENWVRVLPESLNANTKQRKTMEKPVFTAIVKDDKICQDNVFQAVFVVFVIQSRYGLG